jgi:hypothetical protein
VGTDWPPACCPTDPGRLVQTNRSFSIQSRNARVQPSPVFSMDDCINCTLGALVWTPQIDRGSAHMNPCPTKYSPRPQSTQRTNKAHACPYEARGLQQWLECSSSMGLVHLTPPLQTPSSYGPFFSSRRCKKSRWRRRRRLVNPTAPQSTPGGVVRPMWVGRWTRHGHPCMLIDSSIAASQKHCLFPFRDRLS